MMQTALENCGNVSLFLVAKKSRSKAYCSALNCGNAKFKKPEISYFRFPREPKRSRLWVNNCGLKSVLDDIPVQTLYKTRLLCSEHFEPSQFMNPETRNKLIWKAIPTIFKHNRPVKQELDRETRKPAVILPNTWCLPQIWRSTPLGFSHCLNGPTSLNPVQVVNNCMNPVQVVNTMNPIHIVNANMNQIQVVRTVANPVQVTNSVSNQSRVVKDASDLVRSLETSSTPVRTISSPPFTLHLTCEDIPDNQLDDSGLESNKTGQIVYLCCEKCNGLWRKKSFPSNHLLSCCGTVDASPAHLFAIERELLMVLRTHISCLKNKMEHDLLRSDGYGGGVEALCEENNSCDLEHISDLRLSYPLSTSICSKEAKAFALDDHIGKDDVSMKAPYLLSASLLTRGVNTEEVLSTSLSPLSNSDLATALDKAAGSLETLETSVAAETAPTLLSEHLECNIFPDSDAGNSTLECAFNVSVTSMPDAVLEKTDCVEDIHTVSDCVEDIHTVSTIRQKRQATYSMFLVDTYHKGKQEKRYQCSSCSFSTRMVGFFDRHVRSCHSGRMMCYLCSSSFENRSRFRKHMNVHVRPFMCEFCSQCFAEKREMEKHAWIHKEYLPFQCGECEYRCRYKRLLLEHSRKHTGDVLECREPGCGFTTCYRWALENHGTMKHSTCKRFICDSCEYCTNCRGSLKKHKRLHQGRGDYVCSLCPFQAVVRDNLVRHLRKHTSEKVYFCSICSYSTAYSSSLHVHLMHHVQLKPWKCGSCDYQAITKQSRSPHAERSSIQ